MADKLPKKSILTEKEKEQIDTPDFSVDEQKYLNALRKKLEETKTERDKQRREFDGMTLTEHYRQNEEWANTEIQPKKNRSDVTFRSGTLRTKLMAFLSSLTGLNLAPDVSAYNKKEIGINELGNAMEDVIEKTQELEQDEEKRMLRQYELLKQGTVFNEEIWEEKWIIEKDMEEKFNGKFKGVKWTPRKKKEMGRPVKNMIPLTSVYLGDITQYFIENQPFIFTVQKLNYSVAKQIYGDWEMWKYVSKEDKKFLTGIEEWRLIDNKKEQVEVIKFQDKPNNEYQIILTGIPMLPPGYPLSEVTGHGEYSISQQNLEPIRQNFAYGKSFVSKTKDSIALLDEMTKLAVLKTQKSFMPPYFNISGRVISSRVLMPGKITMGIDTGALVPVSDKETQGVTAGEFNMIQEITKTVDRNTASQTFTGAQEEGKGQVTATQIIELQRQARIMMGIIILSASSMEKKVHTLRLLNILANWFDPIDEVVDKARGALKAKYRIVSMERPIAGEGQGLRMVIPTDKLPTSKQIQGVEDQLQDKLGMPVRITALKPAELKQAKYTWVINVYPREKKSSEMAKLMFAEEIGSAIDLGLPLNMSYVTQRFAEVWEEDVDKMFQTQEETEGMTPEGGQPPVGATPKPTGGARTSRPAVKANIPVSPRKGASGK